MKPGDVLMMLTPSVPYISEKYRWSSIAVSCDPGALMVPSRLTADRDRLAELSKGCNRTAVVYTIDSLLTLTLVHIDKV